MHELRSTIFVVALRWHFPLPLCSCSLAICNQELCIDQYPINIFFFAIYFSLVSFKVLISIVLAGKAINYIAEHKEREKAEAEEKKSKQQILLKRKSSWDPSYSAHKVAELTRSKSVGARLNQTAHKRQHSDDVNIRSTVVVDKDLTGEKGVEIPPPLTQSKPLFSNSTVSLESVGLNEEMIRDKLDSKDKTSPSQVRQRTTSGSKSAKKEIPLHEIDRYDMCSNRII